MYKEKFDFKKSPDQIFVLPYLLLVLHKLGGTARAREVVEELTNLFNLSDEVREEKTLKTKVPIFSNNVAFAKLRLKHAGYLDSPKRGIWQLTESGKEKIKEIEEGGKDVFDKFRKEVKQKSDEEVRKLKKEKEEHSLSDEKDELESEETPEEIRRQKDLEKIKNKGEFDFKKPPSQAFILPYLLLVLHRLGGTARNREVVEELIDLFNLSDKAREEKTFKTNASIFSKNVAFSRLHLKNAGYLDAPERGIWELTESGKEKIKELEEGGKDVFGKFRKEVKQRSDEEIKKLKKEKEELSLSDEKDELESEETPEEIRRRRDLEKIKNLDPYAFERLCARILKAVGYEDVEATKKSKDGGIDGIGYLSLGLIRFKVVFQAKKFEGTKVSTKDINALAGTMTLTKAEKAIFITTSYFTRDARKVALEYGIELVNGEKLMELLYEHEIGYSKNFDEEFFANI